MNPALGIQRRHFIAASALPLLACGETRAITGGFTGISQERGHWLRDRSSWPAPSVTRNTEVIIAGGGVAGLAAARALRLRGVEDFAVLELEDSVGGNARAGQIKGLTCPQGAHYLPVPGDDAPEVQALLEEFGLLKRVAGRWEYDERHLCHSPQERLFFKGEWQDGLLPVQGVGAETLAQYQKFASLVERLRQQEHWSIPVAAQAHTPTKRALATITFAAYLNQHGLSDPQLRWYLNYCCLDDYGAGLATVSAWAGIHYFASRHGFHAPGGEQVEREGLFTWPEGNHWLTERMSAPLGQRLHTGQLVLRMAQSKHGVEVDAFNTTTKTVERWQARRAIVALPIFVAARVLESAPDFLRQAAARTVYAPWLVANIHINAPLHDRPGPAPSWDNVLYGDAQSAPGLGYVDAMHQSLKPVPGATVLSYYRALGEETQGAPAGSVPGLAGRRLLLQKPWSAWRDEILSELAIAHPDLPGKATHVEITRYGHAMAIPVPLAANVEPMAARPTSSKGGQPQRPERLRISHERLNFAHSDWAGYSVFEEAFTMGHAAA